MSQVADFEIAPDNVGRIRPPVVAGQTPSVRVVPAHVYLSPPVFECEVRLVPEDSGFSVYVPGLPGVASQGEDEAEAVEMIVEALVGALRSYIEAGSIPWVENEETPSDDEERRWVVVHV